MKSRLLSAIFITLWLCASANAAQTLQLVTTEWESFTNQGAHSERLSDIVTAAMKRAGYDTVITTERPAFAGSGLNSGRFDGRIDYIDLESKRANFSYSQQYLPLYLHLVSKTEDVEAVRSFAQIRGARVAIENRYAATPPLRLVRDIKWSRNPTTFESISNVAEERSNYLLTDSLFFAEFNRLLIAENEELLHRSNAAIFSTGLHLSLNSAVPNAEQIIQAFNTAIQGMLKDGSMNELLGLPWIMASLEEGQGIALISSSKTPHITDELASEPTKAMNIAYPWGAKSASVDSYFIDGKSFSQWADAVAYLKENGESVSLEERDSYLDPSAYTRILRQW
ncbi:substrate-binding periplasmic protein [Alteromonas facilis]|uniref:substrate-binding periplasmic protein n=1 Tax=Alteromonas facilis TaxID=2048004 RepID=UPI000C28FAD1|nr:transporter substrate-binding domain-containing protein [Alteromonas facilis]